MASRFKSFGWSTMVVPACMIAAATVVYWRDGAERFSAVFFSDLGIFLEILPNMAAGCLIGVFATLLVPKDVVTRLVGTDSVRFGPDFVFWRMVVSLPVPFLAALGATLIGKP
jgi:hypothetical protein